MGLTKHLEAETTPKPAEGGVWSEAGTEGGKNQNLPKDQLHEIAQRMKAWCVSDLKRQKALYLGDDSKVFMLLSAAAILDPRHKQFMRKALTEDEFKKTKIWIEDQAADLLRKDPSHEERQEKIVAKSQAAELQREAKAAQPDEQPMGVLFAITKRNCKGYLMKDLRRECERLRCDHCSWVFLAFHLPPSFPHPHKGVGLENLFWKIRRASF